MKTVLKLAALAIAFGGLGVANAVEGKHNHEGHQMQAEEVMVHAKVNSVNIAERTINVSHGPIRKLHWPAMTMDMKVSDNVDIASLDSGQEVMIALARGNDGIFRITKLMIH